MVIFFLEIAVMLLTALLCGQLARKVRLPAVLGELVGGILLGPTVWGFLSPGSQGWLFPAAGQVFMGRDAIVQLCMLFFLFAAGLGLNLGLIKARRKNIAWTSLLGIAIPFALGFGAVVLMPGLWQSQIHVGLLVFALFMGTALSISALPVISRILMDLDLINTDTGAVVMGSATVNDLIGWSLFALVIGSYAGTSAMGLPPYLTIILTILFFTVMLTAGRTTGKKAVQWLKSHLPWPGGFIGIAAVFMLLLGALAEAIGIHAVFGAFLLGVALSQGNGKRDEAHEMLYQFVMYFFAPLYFVSIGLRADFAASFDPILVIVVLLIACAGKISGASLGARISGLPARQAVAIGFAMNARGAMEMILATVARDAGIIDDRIFVALIVMALVTSIISGPAINWLSKERPVKLVNLAPEKYRRMSDFEDRFPEED
jgi:Kef-type K+ transport system membrane component KefB